VSTRLPSRTCSASERFLGSRKGIGPAPKLWDGKLDLAGAGALAPPSVSRFDARSSPALAVGGADQVVTSASISCPSLQRTDSCTTLACSLVSRSLATSSAVILRFSAIMVLFLRLSMGVDRP
jgi:hypothetical protein